MQSNAVIPKQVNKQKKFTASELDQTLCTGCVWIGFNLKEIWAWHTVWLLGCD